MKQISALQKSVLRKVVMPCGYVMDVWGFEGSVFGPESKYFDPFHYLDGELFTKTFGINPESILQESKARHEGNSRYREFSSPEAILAFVDKHMGEEPIHVFKSRVHGAERAALGILRSELLETPGLNSEYDKYGRVRWDEWKEKLAPFCRHDELRYGQDRVSSFFSSVNRGTWISTQKAFILIELIDGLLNKPVLLP